MRIMLVKTARCALLGAAVSTTSAGKYIKGKEGKMKASIIGAIEGIHHRCDFADLCGDHCQHEFV